VPVSGEEQHVLAAEHDALRRVATLVARGAPQEQVFAAVVQEIGRLLLVDVASMERYEPTRTTLVVASWGPAAALFPVGARQVRTATSLSTMVLDTGSPVRIDSNDHRSRESGVAAFEMPIRSVVGTPITVEGRPWGVMVAGATRDQPLPAGTETRLASFTELVATAIANAESRAGLAGLAAEQAALRRVATLVARGVEPEEVFTAVVTEVGQLLAVDLAHMIRYEPDGTLTFVAALDSVGEAFPAGSRWPLEGKNLATMVFETGRPARIDSYAEASGPLGVSARDTGFRSAVATPIIVEGHLWGMMFAGSSVEQPMPADTEARLASFTELVATAVANAESRAALADSRARIVAAADETRRQIERDLHDGIQQRLVSLMLELRVAQTTPAPEVKELLARLVRTEGALGGMLEELWEISRGIHPAILSKGGLEPALKALARRSALPVELALRTQRRLPEHVEVAAYYVVSEALTNATKHAKASVVTLDLDVLDIPDAIVRLAIRDDGIGGADPRQGSGLVGLSDRIEALGGTLQLTSPPGSGTTLIVEFPLARGGRAASPEPDPAVASWDNHARNSPVKLSRRSPGRTSSGR
jgi:signal transduction histidine kinase